MLDTLIRGGRIVDGTGAPAASGDVGIRDGRIAAIGKLDEAAERVLEVDGAVVAPGFIDVHTHYDAQLFWDPSLRPSPEHGVSTVVAGSCGYSLAPLEARDQDWMLGLLARVEEVPREALDAGLAVDWGSFGDYLRAAERPLGPNVGFLVGHSALRRAAMGEAASSESATPEQVQTMTRLLDESLAAGGLGFATATLPNHVDGESRPTPPQNAEFDELRSLATVCGEHPGTVIQITPTRAPPRDDEQVLLIEMSRLAQRPVSYLLITHADQLELSDRARAEGARLDGQVRYTFGLPVRQSLGDSLLMLGWPRPWPEIMKQRHAAKLRSLRDPETRKRLHDGAMTGKTAPGLASYANRWKGLEINDVPEERMASGRPYPVSDWPGGATHLTAHAEGMEHVLVAGREVVTRGEYTGELPGRVLHSGRDTATVPVGPRS